MAAAVLALTPGPGMAYVVARTVAGGRQEGLASCLGTGLGGMLHVLAAALGLSVLLAQSALAFSLIKYVGAAYLVYLGVRMLMQKAPEGDSTPVSAQGARRAFAEGILVEALNVKTALFFLAFFAAVHHARRAAAAAVGVARQHLRCTQHPGRCHGRAGRPKATQVRVWPHGTGPPDDPCIRPDHDSAGRLAGAEQARVAAD